MPFKRSANVSVHRLLQRITSIGFSPYAKEREEFGTRIRSLRITVFVPQDMKYEETNDDERAPLAARLSEYLALGYFQELSQKIDTIEIFVDDRKAYAFSNGKNGFNLEWSHNWRRDSSMEV